MAGRLKSFAVDRIAQNMCLPKKGFFGWLSQMIFLKRNSFLELNAVKLCNIKPDHKVLELGFGPGVGLEAAYNKVKGGKGKVYGIETSMYMMQLASQRLKKGIEEKKVLLFHGNATNIPLNTDTVHRVFHCNCYYFWPSMRAVMREIYRVMQPGGAMITTLNLASLKEAKRKGFLKYGHTDPVKYMTCLENYGFSNVHIEYLRDEDTGKPFEVIYAEVTEKPAHDPSLFSDDEDDEMEKEVKSILKDKDFSHINLKKV